MLGIGRSHRVSGPVLVILAAACLACEPVAGTTFEPGVEHLPMAGYVHVEGEPATADRALTVRFVGSDRGVASISDDFAVGDLVRSARANFAGEQGLSVNGVPCAGRFAIETERETDVILRITKDGCETMVVRIHDEGEVIHEEVFAGVYGQTAIGATVAAFSLDDPPRHAPLTVIADESGWFEIGSLPPGRYRLDVRSEGAVPVSLTVDLEAGDHEYVELAGPPMSRGSS